MSWKIDWCCYNSQHLGYHTVEKAKGDRNTYKKINKRKKEGKKEEKKREYLDGSLKPCQ